MSSVPSPILLLWYNARCTIAALVTSGKGSNVADRVQAVERALLLLEEVAASRIPPTATELAARAGVNRATAWRLLSTLEHFDLIERHPDSGRYTVSFGAVRLARATDSAALVRRARPTLERLAAHTDGTVFLEVPGRAAPVVLDEARSASPVQIDLVGVRIPLHCGSVGKLHLAALPADELDRYLAGPLAAPTPRTRTDPDALRAELAQCRRSGLAHNYAEHQEDWCGISAAVRDRADRDLAYLNVTLPTYRWTEERLHGLGGALHAAAAEVAERIHGGAG
jgi:DNA-binding IclR family transcriptional regulator